MRGWYWPFDPTYSGGSGSGTGRPVEISALDCFMLYWRIKSLQASGSVTLTGAGFTGLPVPIDFVISQPPSMNETYLEVFGPLAPRYNMTGEQTAPDGNCFATFAPFDSIPEFLLAQFALSMQLDVTAFCSALKPALFRHTAFTASFMGYSVEMWEQDALSSPVVTGSIDITPLEWWPYDNGTGPIYDFATGTELITPVPLGL